MKLLLTPVDSRSTYPIAIGPKNDSHDAVEKIIAADLIHMSNNQTLAFIGGRMNRSPRLVSFSAEKFLSLGDQPECRGGNMLMAGNARSHARWRYACDH